MRPELKQYLDQTEVMVDTEIDRYGTVLTGLAAIAAVGLAILACCLMAGCQTRITGGTTQHQTEAQEQTAAEYTVYDPVTGQVVYHRGAAYHVERESIATTQPSGRGNGTFSLGDSPGEGLLGGLTFKPTIDQFKNAWPLGLLFLVLGGFLIYPLGRYVIGGVILALGCIVILNPGLFVWLAVAAVVLAVVANWSTIRQLVRANGKLLEESDPSEISRIKAIWKSEQSPATQRAVDAAK